MACSVSVVVITRDRPHDLERSLDLLTRLPERPPVVVVDNGSSDPYIPRLRRLHPDVRFIALPANRGAAARTIGVRAAASDYVAFADDDSWWAAGALGRAVSHLERDRRIGLLAGRVVVGPEGRDDPTSTEMAMGPLGPDLAPSAAGPRAVMGCMACGAVVRTRAYLSVGGFAPAMGVGGEEQMLVWDMWSAGWRAVYVDDVVAHHHPSVSRDPSARLSILTRNDLWTAWARLPAGAAARRSVSLLRCGRDHPTATLRGAVRAARRLDWALARRSRLPAEVEQATRRIAA